MAAGDRLQAARQAQEVLPSSQAAQLAPVEPRAVPALARAACGSPPRPPDCECQRRRHHQTSELPAHNKLHSRRRRILMGSRRMYGIAPKTRRIGANCGTRGLWSPQIGPHADCGGPRPQRIAALAAFTQPRALHPRETAGSQAAPAGARRCPHPSAMRSFGPNAWPTRTVDPVCAIWPAVFTSTGVTRISPT